MFCVRDKLLSFLAMIQTNGDGHQSNNRNLYEFIEGSLEV